MDQLPARTRARSRGFTLVEIIVVIAVITLLAGVIVPMVSGVSNEGKVAKVLALVDTLRKGCLRHYANTGTLAREYSGTSYTAATYHQLSITQTTTGWKGPYLDHPITQADNPFGGFVYVYNTFNGGGVSPGGGFNLNGGSADTATGSGQFVAISGVSQEIAQQIDDALDRDIPGTWSETGRVEWITSSGGTVMIYLMDI